MLIRKMKIEDLDSVMQIWLKTNQNAHSFISEQYWINNFNAVKTALPEAEVYIAEQQGVIAGFIGIYGNYIAGIFVCEQMQSQGIGAQLLHTARDRYPTLRLHVYKKNHKAVSFYKKQNFIIKKSQIDNNTGEEELLMEWEK